MKNKFTFLLFALIFFFALLFLKDRLIFIGLQKIAARIVPGSRLSARSFVVWPGFVAIKDFEFKGASGASGEFLVNGQQAVFRFSAIGFFARPHSALNDASISISNLKFGGFSLEGLKLDASKNFSSEFLNAILKAESVTYNDASIKNIDCLFTIYPGKAWLKHFKAHALGGRLFASGWLNFGINSWWAELKLNLVNIEMLKFMEVIGMSKRVEADGFYSGEVRVAVRDWALNILEGELKSESGGKFIILDTSLIDNRLGQFEAQNLVVENLKNYHYDIGYINLLSEGQDVKVGIKLEGSMGERDLDVVWHKGE